MRIRQRATALACFLLALSLLPASLPAALGQEPPAGKPAPDSPKAAPPPEDDDPATAPDEETRKRRLLRRILPPGQLTAEEQVEAARLSKIVAAQGTDPTALVSRFETRYQYNALTTGSRSNLLEETAVFAFRGNWVLRVDVPELWTDPNLPRTSNQSGVSDLFVRTGNRVFVAPGYAVFAAMDVTFPTAARPSLGTGKYTIGPAVATSRVFPGLSSFIFGFLQHQVSVGGDPARKDITISRLALTWNTVWGERGWTQVQAQSQIDWNRNNRSSMSLEFEGGWSITKEWRVFVHPGVGLWGRDVLGNYDWIMQVGVRRMFPSF